LLSSKSEAVWWQANLAYADWQDPNGVWPVGTEKQLGPCLEESDVLVGDWRWRGEESGIKEGRIKVQRGTTLDSLQMICLT
jgi:hypothetical protein